jgi:hypothetical protein
VGIRLNGWPHEFIYKYAYKEQSTQAPPACPDPFSRLKLCTHLMFRCYSQVVNSFLHLTSTTTMKILVIQLCTACLDFLSCYTALYSLSWLPLLLYSFAQFVLTSSPVIQLCTACLDFLSCYTALYSFSWLPLLLYSYVELVLTSSPVIQLCTVCLDFLSSLYSSVQLVLTSSQFQILCCGKYNVSPIQANFHSLV